jgi:ketosteroid isomerase-like protein
MNRIMQIIVALMFIGGAISAFAQSNNGKIVEQIIKLEAAYSTAAKNRQPSDFERFYTPDFLMTMRLPPRILDNEQRRKNLADPNFRRGAIESLTDDDVKVRVYGNSTAIVTGHWKRTSKDADGKNTSASGRFTRVWVKQNGKWLLAGAHYSPDVDLEKLKAAATQNEGKKN